VRLGGLLGVMLLLFAVVPSDAKRTARTHPARDQAVPGTYFGMHIHRAVPMPADPTSTPWPTVPFGAWRLWDARVAWPWLEPQPGEWDFSLLDRYVALAESAHVEVLLPLGLCPSWASARPTEPSAYEPGYASEPKDIEAWDRYVDTVVTRYRGRIKAYEIWNEPNLATFFSGHVEDMVRLAQTAYVRIKKVDPAAVVVSPAATGRSGIEWLESYLSAGGGRWADAIGYHFYVGQDDTPESMSGLIDRVRAVVDKQGLPARPIWNTETGWQVQARQALPAAFKGRVSSGALEDTLAAAFVARALVLGWAFGLDRFYWYSWDNYRMGLVEPDGTTPKPAAAAFRMVREWLLGASVTNVTERPNGSWVVDLARDGQRRAVIAWNPKGPARFQPPPFLRRATTRDLAGVRRALDREELRRGLVIGPSPILIERLD